ncbi:MAG TPA: BatD family protein [Xanthomonadaceae bacterium]|nr:BatD family protein [Xanthomonadaceae bacterium]
MRFEAIAFAARTLLFAAGLLSAIPAGAHTRAWLDRDRIGADETATLNIETDQATAGAPDYAPLSGDFTVSGNTSSRQIEMVNGRTSVRVLYGVALQPKREGVLAIPPLRVGRERTQSLTLTVTAPQAAPARAGDVVFVEAEADAQSPYAQQAVGYTVRLYYATALVSGQLDQPAPEGASLQRVGEDVQYERDLGGRHYRVLERHYLLIPERSGTLTIPGARFSGRGVGGFFDDLLGGDEDLRATSPPRFLRVRPIPANAPQPWLPLRALTLRWSTTPQSLRAGEAATVVVQLEADGATAAQLPELQLQADGAQVFADPVQADERFADGRPQVQLTRRFSVVPTRAGRLRIAGPTLSWWDVRAGTARTASLPDLVLKVAPGATPDKPGASVPAQTAETSSGQPTATRDWRMAARPWAWLAVGFAVLWLLTLGWALRRRGDLPDRARPPVSVSAEPGAQAPPADRRGLAKALERGDLGDIADALCAAATPPVRDLDALRTRLADAWQRQAVDQLQRARWGDGDPARARAVLREVFRDGIREQPRAASRRELLPPLYPGD